MDDLTCPVCLERYNSSNDPLILPHCGHTICKQCLDTLLHQSACVCPIDRKPLQISSNCFSIHSWPKNFALMNIIEKYAHKNAKIKTTKCKLHDKSRKFVCRSCNNDLICFKCALQFSHKNHCVEELKDCLKKQVKLLSKAEERYKIVSDKHNEFDAKYNVYKENLLKNNRIELENKVDKFFDRLLMQVTDEIELKRNRTKREVTIELRNAIHNVDKDVGYFNIALDLENVKQKLKCTQTNLYSEKITGTELLNQFEKDFNELKGKLDKLEYKIDINSKTDIDLSKKKLIHFRFMFDDHFLPQILDQLIHINKESLNSKKKSKKLKPQDNDLDDKGCSTFRKSINFYSFVNLSRYEKTNSRSNPQIVHNIRHSLVDMGNNSVSFVSIPYSEQNETYSDRDSTIIE